MKTPDYVLTEDYILKSDSGNDNTLAAGTFVRPISYNYLPAHIKDSIMGRWFDPDKQVFCWCRQGIFLFPLRIIRRV